MAILVYSEQDVLVVKPEGQVNANNAEEFSETLTDACKKSSRVRLELSEVPYFSSAGLRGLIMGSKVASLKGGSLEICGVGEELMRILEDTGLDQSLHIVSADKTKTFPDAEQEDRTDPSGTEGYWGEVSPSWVKALFEGENTDQLLAVAVYEKSGAWVSLHERDKSGGVRMLFSTVGFIGREGLFYSSIQRAAAGWTCAGRFPCDVSAGFEPLSDRKPFTEGRIAIPGEKLSELQSLIKPGCILVVDAMEKLGGKFE